MKWEGMFQPYRMQPLSSRYPANSRSWLPTSSRFLTCCYRFGSSRSAHSGPADIVFSRCLFAQDRKTQSGPTRSLERMRMERTRWQDVGFELICRAHPGWRREAGWRSRPTSLRVHSDTAIECEITEALPHKCG